MSHYKLENSIKETVHQHAKATQEPPPLALRTRPAKIKGLFVNSHVAAISQQAGPDGHRRLCQLVPGQVRYHAFEDVPVSREVEILQAALRILPPHLAAAPNDYQLGRLHFQNFSRTPFARLIFPALPKDIIKILLRGSQLARHIYTDMAITVAERSATEVKITITNDGYPPLHWAGFLDTWAAHCHQQTQTAMATYSPELSEYVVSIHQ